MARVALVTGGTRGIGHAISIALKNSGYRVVASYAGNDAAAQAFQAETGIPVYKFDVGNYEATEKAVQQISKDVGPIDVLLDDGGHMNHQQIVTVEKALEQVNDGGMILVEDVHASYLPEFGNPSDYSFINYAKKAVDSINARFPAIHHAGPDAIRRKAYSITFYESIVALRIDRRRSFVSSWASNGGAPHPEARDFRHEGSVRSVIF